MSGLIAAYLWANAATYLGFGLWCAARPGQTSRSLGYEQLSAAGRGEFLSIYGGLELGLAAIFATLAWRPDLSHLGLWLGLMLYGGILPFRAYSLWRYRIRVPMVLGLALGELIFLLLPLGLLLARG